MFPINGRPLGPGGYGSLDALGEPRDRRYLASATRETATQTGTAKLESGFGSSNIMREAGQREGTG